jgi:hypothetical protein
MPSKSDAATIPTVMASLSSFRQATDHLCDQATVVWQLVKEFGFPLQQLDGRPVLRIRAGMSALRPAAWPSEKMASITQFKLRLNRWWRALGDVEEELATVTEEHLDCLVENDFVSRFTRIVNSIRTELHCPKTDWCKEDFTLWFVEWALLTNASVNDQKVWLSEAIAALLQLAVELKELAKSVEACTEIHGLTRKLITDSIEVVRKSGKALSTKDMETRLRSRLGVPRSAALLCLQVLRKLGYYSPASGRAARVHIAEQVNEVIEGLKLQIAKC